MILNRVLYGSVTVLDLVYSFIILMIAAFIGKIISLKVQRSLKDKVSRDRLNTLSKIINYSLVLIGFFVILPLLQVNLSGLLLAGGIMAIVIGFATQSIVSNLISGIFLTFERPLRVDDVVSIGGSDGALGIVEDIRIISTSVRTFDGVFVRIPNEKVFTGNIVNYLENVARRFEYDVGIRYQDDADEAMEIIKEVIDEHPLALKNPPPQVFVQKLGSSAVEIRVRVWGPSTDWYQIRMELLWKIKKTLEENGIKVPFNQQEVWFMNDTPHKNGG